MALDLGPVLGLAAQGNRMGPVTAASFEGGLGNLQKKFVTSNRKNLSKVRNGELGIHFGGSFINMGMQSQFSAVHLAYTYKEEDFVLVTVQNSFSVCV